MSLPKGMTLVGEADSPLVAHVRKALVTALVQRSITCPRTGAVLDVRTCVVLLDTDGDPAIVLSQGGWAAIVAEGNDETLEQRGFKVDPSTVRPETVAGASSEAP